MQHASVSLALARRAIWIRRNHAATVSVQIKVERLLPVIATYGRDAGSSQVCPVINASLRSREVKAPDPVNPSKSLGWPTYLPIGSGPLELRAKVISKKLHSTKLT